MTSRQVTRVVRDVRFDRQAFRRRQRPNPGVTVDPNGLAPW